jgi:CubicO group peptidase (beta-lactamase class C family)
MLSRTQIIKTQCFLFTILTLFLSCGGGSSSDNNTSEKQSLEVISPEEAGWSAKALAAVEEVAIQGGYAAVMALYDGKIFYQWGNVSKNYKCHSIRKPFLSALYGIYVQRGDIDLDATLDELNIDDIPPSLTDEEKQATVRHLIKSRSGVYHKAAAEAPEMEDARPARGSHPPDTFYYYNNWDFNVAGTIFMQETGEDIFEAFKREIADVIGMQDFSLDHCGYSYELEKSEHPAYPFRMSARDMARFGVLYLNNGKWQDREIIPIEWIVESTTVYSIFDSTYEAGYGYMWMIAPEGSPAAELFAYPCFFHSGIGVHLLIVMPDLQLVMVIRLDTDGDWVDPGDELQMQLISMIINARIND